MSAAGGDSRGDGMRWSDEDLLQLLLEGRTDELAQAGFEADVAARLRDLETFLERTRAALLAPASSAEAGGERMLAARVLARTTRLDGGWRGDLRLVARFVGDRLGASPLLRVAAAVMLLQLFALPVLAWIAWRAPERSRILRARVERQRVEPFLPAVPEEPLGELGLEVPDAGSAPREELRTVSLAPRPTAGEAAEARRAAASALRSTGWPEALVAGNQGTTALRLLGARARLSEQGPSAEILSQAAGLGSSTDGGGLERALRVELMLDLLALTGQPPAGLPAALASLGSDAREADPVRRLEALAVERARTFGALEATAWARLADAGAHPGARALDPLDAAWRRALGAALAATPETRGALSDEDLGAWLGGAAIPR